MAWLRFFNTTGKEKHVLYYKIQDSAYISQKGIVMVIGDVPSHLGKVVFLD